MVAGFGGTSKPAVGNKSGVCVPSAQGKVSNGGAGKAAKTPGQTQSGAYRKLAKVTSDRDNYMEFIRGKHDAGTKHYGPVRTIITRSHSGIVGEFPSTKVGFRPLPYESQNEWRAFALRETDPDGKIYHAQPLSMILGEPNAGRRYTADLLTVYWNGRMVLEEVKPAKLLLTAKVMERHEKVRAVATAWGWEFRELSDQEVARQPRLANSEVLIHYSRERLDPVAIDFARTAVEAGLVETLGGLMREMVRLSTTLSDLYAMAARGVFDIDLDSFRLSPASRVKAAKNVRRYFPC